MTVARAQRSLDFPRSPGSPIWWSARSGASNGIIRAFTPQRRLPSCDFFPLKRPFRRSLAEQEITPDAENVCEMASIQNAASINRWYNCRLAFSRTVCVCVSVCESGKIARNIPLYAKEIRLLLSFCRAARLFSRIPCTRESKLYK